MAYGGGRGRNGDPFGVSRKQVAGSPIDTMLSCFGLSQLKDLKSCCNGATAESQQDLKLELAPPGPRARWRCQASRLCPASPALGKFQIVLPSVGHTLKSGTSDAIWYFCICRTEEKVLRLIPNSTL